jgi:hypothetical protein
MNFCTNPPRFSLACFCRFCSKLFLWSSPVLRSRSWSRSRWNRNFLLEPEPKFFLARLRLRRKSYKNHKFFILKFEVDFKITISLLFTLKNLLMIIYVFKKHENFLKTMKIVEFFLMIWGKLSELEQEFLRSWSRSWSRTKMDRLRNTGLYL